MINMRCIESITDAIAIGPTIYFLRERINAFGHDINSSNIHCKSCLGRNDGGFDPDFGIRICANQMRSKSRLEDTLAHEMIHAYDYLRFKFDINNLRHAACSEVRSLKIQAGNDKSLKRGTDSSIDVERRMSVRKRIFQEISIQGFKTVSVLYKEKSCNIGSDATNMQRQRTCGTVSKRCVGQLLPGHATI